ncbi:MAG: lipopolysaccharide heptosyltransferase family protein, partial [Flavobacterium sp.]
MQRLTKSIGSSNTGAGFDVADGATIKQVLVCRPNHRLGNLLLITPLLDELSTIFPDCQ